MSSASRSKLVQMLHKLATRPGSQADRDATVAGGQGSGIGRSEPCPPEVLVERVAALEKRFDTLESRINGLLLAIAGAVVFQVILTVLK